VKVFDNWWEPLSTQLVNKGETRREIEGGRKLKVLLPLSADLCRTEPLKLLIVLRCLSLSLCTCGWRGVDFLIFTIFERERKTDLVLLVALLSPTSCFECKAVVEYLT